MQGPLAPVVMLPRYSSFLGAGTYTTVPVNAEAYAKVTLTLWRGRMPGTDPTFEASFQDSHDGVEWRDLNGSPVDPGDETATTVRYDLERRWFRVKVAIDATGETAGVSCWAVGAFELRARGD